MLGFDALGKLALGELPQVPSTEDTSTLPRRPLYLRGPRSYWRGSRTPLVLPDDVILTMILTEDGLPILNEIEQFLLVES